MAQDPPRPRVNGIFSSVRTASIGAGATARRTETVTYFHAREREDGVLEVQALGDNVAFGPVMELGLEDFLAAYMPEPQMSQERAKAEATRQAEIVKAVARGDKFLQQDKHFSAEYEYGKALALDEENVRANFGIGLCYLARNDTDKARLVFERLVKLDAAFRDEHKHLFNEFGISLRKAGMHQEARTYYTRALGLCPTDENLHYNIARAAHAHGDVDAALWHLATCLALAPGHEEATRLLTYLRRLPPGTEKQK